MTTLREDMEELARTWEHTGAVDTTPSSSRALMDAHDLRRVIQRHFGTSAITAARHATTEPGDPPEEAEEEPLILPSMKHTRPLPEFPPEDS